MRTQLLWISTYLFLLHGWLFNNILFYDSLLLKWFPWMTCLPLFYLLNLKHCSQTKKSFHNPKPLFKNVEKTAKTEIKVFKIFYMYLYSKTFEKYQMILINQNISAVYVTFNSFVTTHLILLQLITPYLIRNQMTCISSDHHLILDT